MKVILFGKNGKLGRELAERLNTRADLISYSSQQVDLRGDGETIRAAIRAAGADVVINAAAYTQVDQAEVEPDLAYQINAVAAGILAQASRENHALFIHYSTDYIFNGEKGSPYTESDLPDPLNVYGASKLRGEEEVTAAQGAHLILRTSWQYGWHGSNLLTNILKQASGQAEVSQVADQQASPSWNGMIAEKTVEILDQCSGDFFEWGQEYQGNYHLSAGGFTSRYEFARMLLAGLPQDNPAYGKEVLPAASADFPSAAPRPAFSALDSRSIEKRFSIRLPDWDENLTECLAARPRKSFQN